MERATFNKQLYRLKTQWPHSYGDERIARIWEVFKGIADEIFVQITNMAIDTLRTAPLCEELGKLELEVRKQAQVTRSRHDSNMGSILLQSAKDNKVADRDFVHACLKHLQDKLEYKITHEQFLAGCDEIQKIADLLCPKVSHSYQISGKAAYG